MPLIRQLKHHRYIFPGPCVIRSDSCNFLTLIVDRDQTVSRRSKPNSRTILTIEQIDPWKRIHHQDMMSRHRGAKQSYQ